MMSSFLLLFIPCHDTSHTVCPSYGFAFSKIQESWENLSESESCTQATNTTIAAAIKISEITECW